MSVDHPRPAGTPRPASAAARILSSAGRIWVPAALTIAGIVLIVQGGGHVRGEQASDVAGSTAGYGLVLLLVALFVLGVSWLSRMNRQSSRDREREEAARAYFDLHGRWPSEDE